MRRLGVDPGSARVGLARSDEDGRIALPYDTVKGKSPDAIVAELARRVVEDGIGEVVIGLPLRLSGAEGTAARRARRLAARLRKAIDCPVVLWDERFTTVAAERALREAGVRAKDQRQRIDKTAATLLLQSYLDAQEARAGWTPAAEEADDR